MSSNLPRISGRECLKALEKIGFVFIRQTGSHIISRRRDPHCQLSIPDHKELDRETLRSLIRQVDISVEEFTKLL
jgi:predicted RNA binding protein YcfA (HicA-like mRNA interferase family)